MLEVVPSGEKPSLNRSFEAKPLPMRFAEVSRALSIFVEAHSAESAGGTNSVSTRIKGQTPASVNGGILAIANTGNRFTIQECKVGGKSATLSVPPRTTSWQVWRTAVQPSSMPQEFEIAAAKGPPESLLKQACTVYFIPN